MRLAGGMQDAWGAWEEGCRMLGVPGQMDAGCSGCLGRRMQDARGTWADAGQVGATKDRILTHTSHSLQTSSKDLNIHWKEKQKQGTSK